MTLSRIHGGDIVRVDIKGRIFLAFAVGREDDVLVIEPVDRRMTYTRATSRQIIAHWRKAGRPRQRPPRRPA